MIGSRGGGEDGGSNYLIVIGGQILRGNRKALVIIQQMYYAMIARMCYNGRQVAILNQERRVAFFIAFWEPR